jgi:integrase
VRGNFPKYELISSHDLRRTFATVLYHETEMEQADIMAMTGHKSERTFLLYIHANPKHIRERAKKHFPQLA